MLVYGKNVAREVLNKNSIVKKVYLKEGFNNKEILDLIEKNKNKVIYKTGEDIDKLVFKIGGGTNFNAASKAFTKRKDVNKICFTDGQDDGDAGIVDKRKDIIWITFENPNFKPDNGKVIYVPKSELMCVYKNNEQDYQK